jgi:hypothetical protein
MSQSRYDFTAFKRSEYVAAGSATATLCLYAYRHWHSSRRPETVAQSDMVGALTAADRVKTYTGLSTVSTSARTCPFAHCIKRRRRRAWRASSHPHQPRPRTPTHHTTTFSNSMGNALAKLAALGDGLFGGSREMRIVMVRGFVLPDTLCGRSRRRRSVSTAQARPRSFLSSSSARW